MRPVPSERLLAQSVPMSRQLATPWVLTLTVSPVSTKAILSSPGCSQSASMVAPDPVTLCRVLHPGRTIRCILHNEKIPVPSMPTSSGPPCPSIYIAGRPQALLEWFMIVLKDIGYFAKTGGQLRVVVSLMSQPKISSTTVLLVVVALSRIPGRLPHERRSTVSLFQVSYTIGSNSVLFMLTHNTFKTGDGTEARNE